jgi:3-methyladenine DNA glycosylase AlkD
VRATISLVSNSATFAPLAKKIKSNHELGQALWKTGNIDAQFLAAAPMIDLSCPVSPDVRGPRRFGVEA